MRVRPSPRPRPVWAPRPSPRLPRRPRPSRASQPRRPRTPGRPRAPLGAPTSAGGAGAGIAVLDPSVAQGDPDGIGLLASWGTLARPGPGGSGVSRDNPGRCQRPGAGVTCPLGAAAAASSRPGRRPNELAGSAESLFHPGGFDEHRRPWRGTQEPQESVAQGAMQVIGLGFHPPIADGRDTHGRCDPFSGGRPQQTSHSV